MDIESFNTYQDAFIEKWQNTNFEFCGINWWPLIKVQVCYQLHLQSLNGSAIVFPNTLYQRNGLKTRLKTNLKYVSQLLKKSDEKSGIVIFTALEHYTTPYNEELINQFTDPFLSNFDAQNINYQLYNQKTIVEQFSGYDILKKRFLQISINKFKHSALFSEQLKALNDYLINEIDPDFKMYFFLSNSIIETYSLYKLYTYFFHKNSFSGVLMYCYYNNTNMAITMAAHRNKIPVIEYQHSQVTSNHFAYSKWAFEYNKQSPTFFPSIIWAWRDSDKMYLQKEFSNVGTRVIKGGNVFISMYKKIQAGQRNNSAKKILISLQGIGLPDFIKSYITNSTEYVWYLRLHPRYPLDKDMLTELKLLNPMFVEIEKANTNSIYDLLSDVDYHITCFSGTAIEAQSFGVTNLIYGEKGYQTYQMQIDKKVFFYIYDTESLDSILKKKLKSENNIDIVETDPEYIDLKIKEVFNEIN